MTQSHQRSWAGSKSPMRSSVWVTSTDLKLYWKWSIRVSCVVIEVTNDDAWISDGFKRATITSTHGKRANHNVSLVFENWGRARGLPLSSKKYQLNCTLQKRQLETKVILATTDLAGSVIALAWWSWSYSSLMVPPWRTVFAAFSAGRPLILAAYMLKMGWTALFPSPQKKHDWISGGSGGCAENSTLYNLHQHQRQNQHQGNQLLLSCNNLSPTNRQSNPIIGNGSQ